MATIVPNSTNNTITSTSSELNGNKKTDTAIVSDSAGDNEKKITIKQHHNDEGEYKQTRQIMNVSFNMIDNRISTRDSHPCLITVFLNFINRGLLSMTGE